MDIAQLEKLSLDDLRQQARDAGVNGFSRMKRQDLLLALLRDHAEKQGLKLRGGVLEVVDD
ncbi:MAG: Rho termination factor N-terminal domain-containing protein, partial [Anaerolineae bacterium]|nr:Rho termination factor N-terminal domain-containing protein [Anaerolineae bacterium]